nr:MAG TPA: hypothetical protein [Caudoviricetes sp.]
MYLSFLISCELNKKVGCVQKGTPIYNKDNCYTLLNYTIIQLATIL